MPLGAVAAQAERSHPIIIKGFIKQQGRKNKND